MDGQVTRGLVVNEPTEKYRKKYLQLLYNYQRTCMMPLASTTFRVASEVYSYVSPGRSRPAPHMRTRHDRNPEL
jgi:hypothetical protein